MGNQGMLAQLVGGIVIGITGVVVVAGIYQLNRPNSPIVPAAASVSNTALSGLFKGTYT